MSSEMEWKLVPVDDPARSYSDPGFPDEMVWAGIEAMERAEDDLKRNTGPDWDTGMICVAVYRAMTAAAPEPPAPAGEVAADLEEAIRLAEVGEYLYSSQAYSYGDGYTEPREYGIDWQWQQSKPDEYGQGALLAAAVKWHEEQAEEGTTTEAMKLRAALTTPPTVSPDAVRRAALEEWRDARQAVFDLGAQGKVSPEQWDRLSRAEHALMDIARALATQPAPDGRG